MSQSNVLSSEALQLVADGTQSILSSIDRRGQLDRKSTAKTPERVSRMYQELLQGYAEDPLEIIRSALFDVEHDAMVVVGAIDFFSLCEHHLMPFYGKIHVGYLPDKRIVGLSKIPRAVNALSRRLQVQERLTTEIARATMEGTEALGVGVVTQASHLCSTIRGVRKQNAVMVTSAMLGNFKSNLSTREEFMEHINQLSPR